MKTCTKCKIEKSDEEFSFKYKTRNILQPQCKMCVKERDYILYQENTNNRKTKIRNRAKDELFNVKKFYRDYKMTQKCSKCGDDRWYVIDFHHTNDKIMSVASIVKRGSIRLLKEELEKCIPLCANCHRELHYTENTLGTVVDEVITLV